MVGGGKLACILIRSAAMQEGDLGSSEGNVADRKASNDAASTSAASAGSRREQALAMLMDRREKGSG